jgi:drug/metabolite transporter (DMT)-like permease
MTFPPRSATVTASRNHFRAGRASKSMTSAISNPRGIAAMLFATASFVVCDTFMKRATESLPPFEVLFLRGIFATICCAGLLMALGQGRSVGRGFSTASLLRGGFETASVLCYIVALASMAIADVIAIVQTAPLIFILLVATIGRERVGSLRIGLIAAGFVGAVLVAQPDTSGFSPAALLAFASALLLALRDIFGRKVSAEIPALAAVFATNTIVMVTAGVLMLLNEDVVTPSVTHTLYLLAAGFFVTLGHFGIFIAYRLGAPGVIAPFFYSFAVWAVLSGLFVFHQLPNPVALLGIATIVASGLGIILIGRRKTADPALAVQDRV